MKKLFFVLVLISSIATAMNEKKSLSEEPVWPISPAISAIYGHIHTIVHPPKDSIYPVIERMAYNETYNKIFCSINFFKNQEQVAALSFTVERTKKFASIFLETLFIKQSYRNQHLGSTVLTQLIHISSALANNHAHNVLFYLKSEGFSQTPLWTKNDSSSPNKEQDIRLKFYSKFLSKGSTEALNKDELSYFNLLGEPLYFGLFFKQHKKSIPSGFVKYNFSNKTATDTFSSLDPFFKKLFFILSPLFKEKGTINIYDRVSFWSTISPEESTSVLTALKCHTEGKKGASKKSTFKNDTDLCLLKAEILQGKWLCKKAKSKNLYERLVQKKFSQLLPL